MSTGVEPEAEGEQATLGVVVVGAGVGREHAAAYHALSDRFRLVAICDSDLARARDVAEAYGVPRATADLAEACRMEEADVIDLCTPPGLHVEHVLRVLDAGKHAVCEKPLAGSLRDVDTLARAEAASGRRVMPIFQYRFGHGLQRLRRLVDQGVTGPAYVATAETAWRRRPEYYAVPWRGRWATELGGTLLGHAIHALDMLTYVLGPVRSVFARMATRVNPIEVEDCVTVSLELASGALASLAVTTGSAAEISRHRFCFANVTAESNTRPYTNSGLPWAFTPDTPEASARVTAALETFDPLPEGFVGQLLRFHRALGPGLPLPVTLAEARAVLEIVTAAYVSATARSPVTLPLTQDHAAYEGWQPNA